MTLIVELLLLDSLSGCSIISVGLTFGHMQKFHGQVGGLKVQTVDTTGAGDAFCAGLLSPIAQSTDIIEVRANMAFTYWLGLSTRLRFLDRM